MNNWWLKLYTIPQTLRLLKGFLVATILLCCTHSFVSLENHTLIPYLIYFYPLKIFLDNNRDGMRANLDFHKMTIPLAELRKAYYSDLLLQISGLILASLLSLSILGSLFWTSQFFDTYFSFVVSSPSVTLGYAVPVFSTLIYIRSTLGSKRNRRTFLLGLFNLIVTFVWILICAITSLSVPLSIAAFFGAYYLVALFHFSQFEFHQYRDKGKFIGKLRVLSAGTASWGVLFFIFGILSRIEMGSSFLSMEKKFKTMSFYSGIISKVEVQEARKFLAMYPDETKLILENTESAIYKVPVKDVLITKDLEAYHDYLLLGKPTKENLAYMTNELRAHPKSSEWKNSWNYAFVRTILSKRFPEAKTLEQNLIKDEKIRNIASEKEERGR